MKNVTLAAGFNDYFSNIYKEMSYLIRYVQICQTNMCALEMHSGEEMKLSVKVDV